MHFNKPAVTMRDKKKAKNTARLFGIFAGLMGIATVLSIVFMPKAKTIVGIDNAEKNEIENFTSLNDGEEFVAISKDKMQVFDTDTGEILSTFSYVDEVLSKVQEDGVTLPSSLFVDQAVHYEKYDDNSGYVLLFDSFGDLFKLDYSEGQLSLNDSYFLTDRYSLITNGNVTTQINNYKVRHLYITGDDLYVLSTNNNKFVVNLFDLNNISAGVQKSRFLYSFKVPSPDEYSKIETAYKSNKIKDYTGHSLYYDETPFYIADPILSSSGGESMFDTFTKDGYCYITSSNGIYKFSLDFKDFDNIGVFEDTKSFYIEKMRSELLSIDQKTRDDYGISEELFNSLPTASNFIVSGLFETVFYETYFDKVKVYYGEDIATNNEWLAYANPDEGYLSHAVYSSAVDEKCKNFLIDKGAEFTLDGLIYASKNDSLYLINDKDNYIYTAPYSVLNDFSFRDGKTFFSVATQTSVRYKGKIFGEQVSAIGYDKASQRLHVTFKNDRDISLIEIGEDGLNVLTTFKARYGISTIHEKKDGSKSIIFYKTTKTTIHNVTSTPYHIDVINPMRYQYHTLFVIFAVIFAVLCAACLVVMTISLVAARKEKKMLKLKVVKRDLKRNKWTYVALIPFILLLIMFCYVEAIGSISFSFFSYTMDQPSYIWNDFGNYIKIFHDSEFWLMFGNTFFFLVFDLILGIIPPIIFAFFLTIIKNQKLSGTLRALMFIPAIVPGIASLLIWRIGIFGDTGVLNILTCFFRTGKAKSPDFTPIKFLVDPDLSRWSLLLMGFPYVGGYLIFYGGLMNVPNEYHEAAQLEGLGVLKRFFTIDLPLIKPQIKYILVMGILSSAQNYERTYMLGSTGTTTLVESMYRQMKDYTNYGKASAYATIIFLLLLVPVLINFKDTRKTNLGDQI